MGKWETTGQFGDTFGVANALFSGLAFCGVIIAIILQKRELKLQREELERSTKAQAKTAQALSEQNKYARWTTMLQYLNQAAAFYQQQIDSLIVKEVGPDGLTEDEMVFKERIMKDHQETVSAALHIVGKLRDEDEVLRTIYEK